MTAFALLFLDLQTSSQLVLFLPEAVSVVQQLWFFFLSKLIKNAKEYCNVKPYCSPRECLWKFFILFKLRIYVFTLTDSYASDQQVSNFPRSNFFFLTLERHIKDEGIFFLLFKKNWGIYRYNLEEGRGASQGNCCLLYTSDAADEG